VAQLACDTVRQAVRIRRASRGDDPATAGDAAGRALTVEIHDVSPATRAEVDALREALAGLGVDRTTLLVVPSLVDDEGRRWDLREDERLVDWLHARRADGSEIVQHGLTHRAGDPPPGLCHAVLHSWFSRGGDEFAHVSLEEARDRLREGRAILRACGFEPLGFVAPCWLQSRGTCTALEELGYRFTAFLDRVQPLPGDREPVRTPALTFASANAWVDHGKRVVMRGCEVVARPAPLLRVALHPSDLHGSRPAGHALERLRRLLRYRRLVTYEEWLAARATARGAAA
jgi:predicted deacetylase